MRMGVYSHGVGGGLGLTPDRVLSAQGGLLSTDGMYSNQVLGLDDNGNQVIGPCIVGGIDFATGDTVAGCPGGSGAGGASVPSTTPATGSTSGGVTTPIVVPKPPTTIPIIPPVTNANYLVLGAILIGFVVYGSTR